MNIKYLSALCLTVTTLLTPAVARAEFVHIGTSESGNGVYIDDVTIYRRGDYVVFWQGFKSPTESSMSKVEANCHTGKYRLLEIVTDKGEHQKYSNPPILSARYGSAAAGFLDYACNGY